MVCPNNPSDCSGPQKRRKTLLTRDNIPTPTPTPPPTPNIATPILKRNIIIRSKKGNPGLDEIIDEIINATKSAKSRLENSSDDDDDDDDSNHHHDIRKRQESTSSTSTVTSTHTHSALSTVSETITVSTEAQETQTQTTTGTSTVSTSTAYTTVTKTGTPNVARMLAPGDGHTVVVMSWVSLVYLAVLVLRVINVVG
ncbi:hypothetical protein AOL_s00006g243 [Orbilia oligospora ATCC 24927]|uniref:Uncharacterized protein n=1 Tax=Arthrobotrys oligospora (strain ATCC 24927 / CBS 115.81 / DSM 1491) TaxID=756982 RepID=G1X042_ARTOA|nr:hypothetical protein AOL_s00006g243 [Orbilia oligospora ATCC 24927]EGX53377.1 hypothetical protein AOL_s00006g243 [Orbilia oligospora ATCC 24927]